MGLLIRRVADMSSGARLVRFDPETGERKLVNPATPGEAHEPWPLAGVVLEDAPEETVISTGYVARGIAEGWIEGVNARPVVRPAGPTHVDWHSGVTGQPHVFVHYDALIFHTLDGDVTYRVVHQPDKYADHAEATDPEAVEPFEADDETPVTPEAYAAGATRVDHFYGIEKEA